MLSFLIDWYEQKTKGSSRKNKLKGNMENVTECKQV